MYRIEYDIETGLVHNLTAIEDASYPETLLDGVVYYEGDIPEDREGYTKSLFWGYDDNQNSRVASPYLYAVYTLIEGWLEIATIEGIEPRFADLESRSVSLESGVATKANQSEVDRLEQGIDAKIATKANQSEVDRLEQGIDAKIATKAEQGDLDRLEQELNEKLSPYTNSIYDVFKGRTSSVALMQTDRELNFFKTIINKISYIKAGNSYNNSFLIIKSEDNSTEVGFKDNGYDFVFVVKLNNVVINQTSIPQDILNIQTTKEGSIYVCIDTITGYCSFKHSAMNLFRVHVPQLIGANFSGRIIHDNAGYSSDCFYSLIYFGYYDFVKELNFIPTVGNHAPNTSYPAILRGDNKFDSYKAEWIQAYGDTSAGLRLINESSLTDRTYSISAISKKTYLTTSASSNSFIAGGNISYQSYVEMEIISGDITLFLGAGSMLYVIDDSGLNKYGEKIGPGRYKVIYNSSTSNKDHSYYRQYATQAMSEYGCVFRLTNPALIYNQEFIFTPALINKKGQLHGSVNFSGSPLYVQYPMTVVKRSLADDSLKTILGQHIIVDDKLYVTVMVNGVYVNKLISTNLL